MHPTRVLRECRHAVFRAFCAIFLAAFVVFGGGLPARAAAHEELSIGIVQFPVTLNPNIDAMAAKSYVLGHDHRPFTVFDADWKLVCMLCTELPSFENGRAVQIDLPDGKTGVA